MSGSYSFMLNYAPKKTEAEAMKELAVSQGVDAKDVLLEQNSNDTIGNAYFCKVNFCMPKNLKKLTVVTSEFHLPRTKFIFDKVFGSKYEINFVCTGAKLSHNELKIRAVQESKILRFTKKWLKDVKGGDHEKVWQILSIEHPGYGKNSKYSTEELLKIINI